MKKLKEKKCVPCEGDIEPISKAQAEKFMLEVEGWSFADADDAIEKHYVFENFDKAMDFVNMVADAAEFEQHHPDIHISYNKVRLEISTHAIHGLSENDFILAAKIDGIRL
jgi:4a-hydroxytetrahydrobiopterin dehydratase